MNRRTNELNLCLRLEILAWRMTFLSGTDEDELSTSYAEHFEHKTRCPRSENRCGAATRTRAKEAREEGCLDNKWLFFSISQKWLITADRRETCPIFSKYTRTCTVAQKAAVEFVGVRVRPIIQFILLIQNQDYDILKLTSQNLARTIARLVILE